MPLKIVHGESARWKRLTTEERTLTDLTSENSFEGAYFKMVKLPLRAYLF